MSNTEAKTKKKNTKEVNGSNYYRMTKTVGYTIDSNGKRKGIKKAFYGKTKKEALAKYSEFMKKQESGIDSKNLTFGQVADNWIDVFYWSSKDADRTKQLYTSAWNNYIKPLPLYNMLIEDVKLNTIQAAYNNLVENGTPGSSIRAAHKLMRKFYKYLARQQMANDFTEDLEYPKRAAPKSTEDITIWTDAEIKTILGNFDKAVPTFRIRFLLILAYYTGCRISELRALTYNDFTEYGLIINKQVQPKYEKDKNGNRVPILSIDLPKSANANRTIPISDVVRFELQRHRLWHKKDMLMNGYKTDYVFTTSSGGFYDKNNLDRAAKYYYKRIGIDSKGKGFHTYRHTFGTNLCRAGVPIQTACNLLGHDNIETTRKYYVKVSQEDKKSAIDSLKSFAQ